MFEALAAPLVIAIAERHGYEVSLSKQTVYPDFTLTPAGKNSDRIAVDVKTTYQRSESSPIVFTLGSYTSFLRNGTKNIRYPYNEYRAHWVLGFVYTRNLGVESKVYARTESLDPTRCPYRDVKYFIQNKHKIAGLRPGSGNTTNIGSFPTCNIQDLCLGKGPFATRGQQAFEKYWRDYKKRRQERL